jgi:hypothetical protein
MFNWLSIVAGFLAGALWLYAANIKVPTDIGSGFAGFRKQAIWNSYAAFTTGAAALFQAAAQLAPAL